MNGPIDATELALFFASPDASDIVAAFNRLEGPIRASVISHAVLLSNHTILDPRMEEIVPQAKQIEHRPLLSTSLEGRVYERKLRGEKNRDIANAECIPLADVQHILDTAKAERKASEGKPAKAKVAKAPDAPTTGEVRRERREAATKLRLMGWAPATIGKRLKISANLVSNLLYEARTKHGVTEWPKIDEKAAAAKEAAEKLAQTSMPALARQDEAVA